MDDSICANGNDTSSFANMVTLSLEGNVPPEQLMCSRRFATPLSRRVAPLYFLRSAPEKRPIVCCLRVVNLCSSPPRLSFLFAFLAHVRQTVSEP